MKKLISIFLIALLIKLSLTIVPIWSFKNSAIEFMGSQSTYEQIMIEKELSDGIYVKFYKIFSRAQNIMKQNFLQFYKRYSNIILEKFVQYEDIDFVHMYNSTIFFICPKGRFHLLYINNGTINTMIPEPFNSLKEWELKCYYQPEFNQIFVAYLNHEDNNAKSIYQFNIETSQFTTSFYKMGIGLIFISLIIIIYMILKLDIQRNILKLMRQIIKMLKLPLIKQALLNLWMMSL